jgi:hypothetical protein
LIFATLFFDILLPCRFLLLPGFLSARLMPAADIFRRFFVRFNSFFGWLRVSCCRLPVSTHAMPQQYPLDIHLSLFQIFSVLPLRGAQRPKAPRYLLITTPAISAYAARHKSAQIARRHDLRRSSTLSA